MRWPGTNSRSELSHDGKEPVETRTIKKLTDTVLVTEDKNRKVEELERRSRQSALRSSQGAAAATLGYGR